ncbi:hypothetical protein [Paracoccus salipaludis]|uniref:hypothetical protein n=1 Tax=Paracoccus salipaludis TaxID=2032623 RepID=UPI00198014F4|nr:hypothetical protein [Paracoccus salipaludis]
MTYGEGSDLLSEDAVEETRQQRPDMINGKVPGRGHIPWLDEGESVRVVRKWVAAAQGAATA